MTQEHFYSPVTGNTYLVHLTALIRTAYPIPTTCADFSLILFSSLPRGYSHIGVVADTYKENSLKNLEREIRGMSS